MRWCLFAALSLGIVLAVTVPSAGATALGDVVSTLETPFQPGTAAEHRIFDYSADFSQESMIASLNRLQRAHGRVKVAFDDQAVPAGRALPMVKFHWQYESPTTQSIVSDGATLWVYLPENNQAIVSDRAQLNQADQSDPMAFLTGLGNLSRDFAINWAKPNQDAEGNFVLEMTPRRSSSLISKLVIVVDRSAVAGFRSRDQGDAAAPKEYGSLRFPILSTTVYDPNGNSTVIRFSNLRLNQGLPDASFDFIIPEGVEVVRPTGN